RAAARAEYDLSSETGHEEVGAAAAHSEPAALLWTGRLDWIPADGLAARQRRARGPVSPRGGRRAGRAVALESRRHHRLAGRDDTAVRDDLPGAARRAARLARRLDRRLGHGAAVRHREVPDRAVPGAIECGVELWGRRLDRGAAGLGLLLRSNHPARR